MAKEAKEDRDKSVRLISKLVQLTQDQHIKWQVGNTAPGAETSFVSTVEERKLRIYRYSEKITNPDYISYTSPYNLFFGSSIKSSGLLGTARPAPPETITRAGIVLEVLDEMNRPVFKFENRTGLSDLYESAAYSASKVDELIDAVLGMK